jgi:carboxyl-terminal processing protease
MRMKKISIFVLVSIFVAGIFYFNNIGHTVTYWRGVIKAPGQSQEMIVVLDRNLIGSVQGRISFPGNLLNQKITSATLSEDSLKLALRDGLDATFKGIKKEGLFLGKWIQNGQSYPVQLVKSDAAPLQQAMVNAMVDYAKTHAVHRSHVNWDSLEKLRYFSVDPAKPDSGLITAADRLLRVLNDDHGFLVYKGEALRNPVGHKGGSSKKSGMTDVLFRGKSMAPQMLTANIAYIRIPTVWALTKEEVARKVSEIEKAICGLNYHAGTNWIIDFRLNNGGNFRPMLTGIANLAGEGVCLYFASDDHKEQEWTLKNDGLYANGILETPRSTSCDVPDYHPKIAVLMGGGSSSAAEDVIVALKGRKGTRFFGEETKGKVTVNSTITLDENTHFSFITSKLKDRDGHVYTEAVKPDVRITTEDNFGDLEKDPKVMAAMKWLNEQGSRRSHQTE